jgi:autotransporter-associated beta strand protein
MNNSATHLAISGIAALLLVAAQQRCFPASATWSVAPLSDDWSAAQNWVPQTVPNTDTDTATFEQSTITNVTLSAFINVSALKFPPDSDAFTITSEPATVLSLFGTGVENSSGRIQTFTCVRNGGFGGGFYFFQGAAAGTNTVFATAGNLVSFNDFSNAAQATFLVTNDPGVSGGDVLFFDDSSAAEATFIVSTAGNVDFLDRATAANAVFTVTGGMYGAGDAAFGTNATAGNAVINCSAGGEVVFTEVATADHARITVAGAASTTESQTHADFIGGSTAANSRITLNGGSAVGTAGAIMNLFDESTAGAAQITLNGGTNGGNGASVVFYSKSNGGTATFKVFENGQIDISKNTLPTIGIGSLEGSGQVFLGARTLTIGSNNHNTLFSGVLQDGGLSGKTGGKLVKTGSGMLTLSGANTYSGGTTVNAGRLTIANTTGSGSGAGAVQVNAGNLTGSGMIAGATTIGSGSGSGALLAPGVGAKNPATLTLLSSLTFNADGSLQERLLTQQAQTDSVVANGITINSGAQFTLQAIGRKRLTSGLVFMLINNTSPDPISGTFANLADGSILNVGRNQLKVSYEGGDGNDLTLTVQ